MLAKAMKKRIFLTLLGLLIVIVVLAGVKGLQISAMVTAGEQPWSVPEVVTSAKVQTQVWESGLSAVGTFESVEGVTVSAELTGKVSKIFFESGTHVKAGTRLLQQDTSSEEAQLREAKASVDLAKINLKRSRRLLATKAVSQSDYDSAEARLKEAVAHADNSRSLIAKKNIRAPFSGRLGIRRVNLGQDLREGDAIVSLQTLNPIYVNFSVAQKYFSKLSTGMITRISSDAMPDSDLQGIVTSINPEVDSVTRNIQLQATVDNDDEKVLPGMFAKINLILPAKEIVSIIPATAVLNAPYGDSVFVIEDAEKTTDGKPSKVVRQQIVRVGKGRGDYVSVLEGLKENQVVVSSGVFKLSNGQAVVIDNKLSPDFKLNPKPEDS